MTTFVGRLFSIKFVVSVLLLHLLLLLSFPQSSEGFAAKKSPTAQKIKIWTKKELPSLDVSSGPVPPPKGVSSREFYLPTYTLLRAGPVSFVQRVLNPSRYENTVYKYMEEFKEDSLMTAQGNADAYLASPDVWIEQKYLEQKGTREVYDYGKPLPLERVVLSSIWGGFTVILFSRVFWQLIHGNRNLF